MVTLTLVWETTLVKFTGSSLDPGSILGVDTAGGGVVDTRGGGEVVDTGGGGEVVDVRGGGEIVDAGGGGEVVDALGGGDIFDAGGFFSEGSVWVKVSPVTQRALAKPAVYRNASLRVTTPNRSSSPMVSDAAVVALKSTLAKYGINSFTVSLVVMLVPSSPMTALSSKFGNSDEETVEFDATSISLASFSVDFVFDSANRATTNDESSVRREVENRFIRFRDCDWK
mmetsp:Transcript_13570/g.34132  ORF Transcript_13570/g.34132 Transcript_13570/m.34132 type:complete len:227 (-) Transcript_13570:317-997(-)